MENCYTELRRLFKAGTITRKQFNKLSWTMDDPSTFTLVQRLVNPPLPSEFKVANITELLEMILINVDVPTLRTAMPRVSKLFRNTIDGSLQIQRRLHYAPMWKAQIMSLAPIPKWMHTYQYYECSCKGAVQPGDQVETNVDYTMRLRFRKGALEWACTSGRGETQSFRRMQLCQPPVVAVDFLCFSHDGETGQYPSVKRLFENKEGVRIGEIVDFMRLSKANLDFAVLTYRFKDGSASD